MAKSPLIASFIADPHHKDGIYTLFSDMGGQPQFWALVANFLRK
jgi:hypothetical protein